MYKKIHLHLPAWILPALFLILVFLVSSFTMNTSSIENNDMMVPDPALSAQMGQYDIKYYKFDLNVSNSHRGVYGMAEIHAMCLSNDIDTLVFQLSTSLTVDSVIINELNYSFLHEEQLLKVPVNLPANQDFTTQVFYGGTPSGNFFTGTHRQYSSEYDRWVTWTFSQPFYAYKWFPCKEIHNDKIDSVHMVLRTDSVLTAVSSGRLVSKSPLDNGRIMYDWRTKYAISYDMIFFAVSEYILYEYYSHPEGYEDSILINHYVYSQEYLDDYKDRLDSIGLFVDYYSEILGLYPFAEESFGLVMVPGLPCMTENNTLVIMPEELDLSFTHTFIDGNCHELVHQWFGDYVACNSYEDIWLSEGFGMYGGYLGEQRFGKPGEAEKWMDKTLQQAFGPQCGSVHVPENKLLNASRIFDWRLTYCKGSMLVHMIRYELQDDDLFFTVLQNYISEFANGTTFLDDFKTVLEETTGKDFTLFFDQWYYGEGYPKLDISWEQNGGMLHIFSHETTTCDTTPLFKFTMDYQLIFAAGDSIVRLYQDDILSEFSIPIDQTVLDIIPDPYRWILTKTNIGYVGVEETGEDIELSVFPNPCSDVVGVRYSIPRLRSGQVPDARYKMIGLYRIDGMKICEKALEGPLEEEILIEVNDLPNGLYLVCVRTGNDLITRKLVINH